MISQAMNGKNTLILNLCFFYHSGGPCTSRGIYGTYLNKERGDNTKFKFDSLWDMGAWIYRGGTT